MFNITYVQVMVDILQERMLNDARVGAVCSNATSTNYPPAFHPTQPAKIVQNGNNLEASPMATPNPFARRSSAAVSKKAEVEQPNDVKDDNAKVSPAVTPLAKIPKKNDNSEGKAKRERDGIADQVGSKTKSSEDGNQAEPQRPLNPFAKSSSSKEQSSSLLDSIKKMKVESEKADKANVKKVKV
jgi:chromosome transmission fidelity protein 4